MNALVYEGPGEKSWQDKPMPKLVKPTDAIVRIPHADNSHYPIDDGSDEEVLVMLSDILPTGWNSRAPSVPPTPSIATMAKRSTNSRT